MAGILFQHPLFTFHDATFECVCRHFDLRTERGSLLDVTPAILALLFEKRQH